MNANINHSNKARNSFGAPRQSIITNSERDAVTSHEGWRSHHQNNPKIKILNEIKNNNDWLND